jgi:hypothetical protein
MTVEQARAFLGRLTPAPPYKSDRVLFDVAMRHVGPCSELARRAREAGRVLGVVR